MTPWLLLSYTLPAKPSALRVGVWRKLKHAGAILHHDAFWILPANPRTREQFRWLTAEINDLSGEASFWEANLAMGVAEGALIRRFQEQVDIGFRSLLERISKKTRDLEAIASGYQQWLFRDYFHSETGKRLRREILKAREKQT
jgi:hypothetical protein